jgi:hypothetical protein
LKSPHFGNNFALEAQQTVYTGGAINANIRKAQLATEQALTATHLTREDQRFLALGQYLELMSATPKAIENVYTGAVMHWGSLTLSVLNLVGVAGTIQQ